MAETKVKQAAPLDVEVGASGGQLNKVELDLDDAPFLQEEKPAAAPAPRGETAPAEPGDGAAEAGKGKGRKKLLILAAAGGVILLVAAAAVWWFMFRTPPPPPPEPPKPDVVVVPSAPAAQSNPDIVKEFAPFVVPTQQGGEGGTRFLVCKFSAIIKDPALSREIDQRMLSLRDAIYFYLRSKDDTFLQDARNGQQIKSDLLGVLNDYMAQGKIEDILFESYLNQ